MTWPQRITRFCSREREREKEDWFSKYLCTVQLKQTSWHLIQIFMNNIAAICSDMSTFTANLGRPTLCSAIKKIVFCGWTTNRRCWNAIWVGTTSVVAFTIFLEVVAAITLTKKKIFTTFFFYCFILITLVASYHLVWNIHFTWNYIIQPFEETCSYEQRRDLYLHKQMSFQLGFRKLINFAGKKVQIFRQNSYPKTFCISSNTTLSVNYRA